MLRVNNGRRSQVAEYLGKFQWKNVGDDVISTSVLDVFRCSFSAFQHLSYRWAYCYVLNEPWSVYSYILPYVIKSVSITKVGIGMMHFFLNLFLSLRESSARFFGLSFFENQHQLGPWYRVSLVILFYFSFTRRFSKVNMKQRCSRHRRYGVSGVWDTADNVSAASQTPLIQIRQHWVRPWILKDYCNFFKDSILKKMYRIFGTPTLLKATTKK